MAGTGGEIEMWAVREKPLSGCHLVGGVVVGWRGRELLTLIEGSCVGGDTDLGVGGHKFGLWTLSGMFGSETILLFLSSLPNPSSGFLVSLLSYGQPLNPHRIMSLCSSLPFSP